MKASLCFAIGAMFMFFAGRAYGHSERDRDYAAAPIVHEHESPDPANRFFDLSFRNDGDDDANRGVAHIGILTDKVSAMASWLSEHDGQRIAITLRGGSPLNRDGQ